MPAHNRTVSSKDVAALAGVSQSTVSYVMSGNRKISQATKDKVHQAMRKLGYVPDAHARAMISNQSRILALVTETTLDTQGAELFPILDAVRDTAHHNGYDVIVVAHGEDVDNLRRLAKSNLVDAFIMLDIRHHDSRLQALADLGKPIVPHGDPGEPYQQQCIDIDTMRIPELAFAEMRDIGARKAVVIRDPRKPHGTDASDATNNATETAFPFISTFERQVIPNARRYGIEVEWFDTPNNRWQSYEPISRMLAQWAEEDVCILVRSPRVAAWIEQMMLLRQIRPGHDIGLICVCTDEFAQAQPVAISNISPETTVVGRRAVEIAIEQVGNRLRSNRRQVQPGLELVAPRFTRRDTTVPGFADLTA